MAACCAVYACPERDLDFSRPFGFCVFLPLLDLAAMHSFACSVRRMERDTIAQRLSALRKEVFMTPHSPVSDPNRHFSGSRDGRLPQPAAAHVRITFHCDVHVLRLIFILLFASVWKAGLQTAHFCRRVVRVPRFLLKPARRLAFGPSRLDQQAFQLHQPPWL